MAAPRNLLVSRSQTEIAEDPEAKFDLAAGANSWRQPALAAALGAIAEAIAAAPPIAILYDLALSKASACFVATERAAEAAPPILRAQIHQIASDAITFAAREIRRCSYQAAYDALDILASKIREMRAH